MTWTSLLTEVKSSQGRQFGILFASLHFFTSEAYLRPHNPKNLTFDDRTNTPQNFSNDPSASSSAIINSTSPSTLLEEEAPEKSTFTSVIICLLCGLVILGTLFGNILVCVAVAVTRKLRTPSNSLIISLAFSDLLIAVAVMPFAAVLEVTGSWIFGQVVCDLWTSLDVLLCTSSILNLCVISIDRSDNGDDDHNGDDDDGDDNGDQKHSTVTYKCWQITEVNEIMTKLFKR